MIEIVMFAAPVLLLDQCSKKIIEAHLGNRQIWGCRLVRLRCVANVRALYGHDAFRVAGVLVWLGAFLSAMILFLSGVFFQTHLALLGLGLAFGGAAGNLCDVLRRRYVLDFIELRWWPVFNLADVAIVAGLLLAFFKV